MRFRSIVGGRLPRPGPVADGRAAYAGQRAASATRVRTGLILQQEIANPRDLSFFRLPKHYGSSLAVFARGPCAFVLKILGHKPLV